MNCHLLVQVWITGFIHYVGGDNHGQRRYRRDTVGFGSRRWPGGKIPFEYSFSTTSETKEAFRVAADAIEKVSCVRFVPRQYETDYVRVITGKGCYSMIGRDGGMQYLSLGTGCFRKGIAIHETMHLVGFFHEQSRLDRDEHVDVHYYNVLPEARRQFKKYKAGEGDTLKMKYDPDSIMHYSNKAFTKNGQDTITYKMDTKKTLGQRDRLSKTDIAQLNKLYRCQKKKTEKEMIVTESINRSSQVYRDLCRDDPWTRYSGQCIFHLYLGDCYRKRVRMQNLCPKTCGFCRDNCRDTSEYCTFFAYYGYCSGNTTIRKRCRKTCRLC